MVDLGEAHDAELTMSEILELGVAMARILIEEDDESTGQHGVVGWFDPERAEKFTPQGDAEAPYSALYHTEGGAWVLQWSWRGKEPNYRFLSNVHAAEWLARNGHPEAADQFFEGPTEKSPGRPEIGGLVQVRLGDLLGTVDEFANEHGYSRAESVRQLVKLALESRQK